MAKCQECGHERYTAEEAMAARLDYLESAFRFLTAPSRAPKMPEWTIEDMWILAKFLAEDELT